MRRDDGVICMYKSPIDITMRDLEIQIENEMLRAVKRVGISVDKGGLMRALAYDREQYEAGFREGYEQARSENQEELTATRRFIHEHGLEFQLMHEYLRGK